MDNCVIDYWETFRGWTPYIVAAGVYWIWYRQKGKEVIASECKAYWTNLTELEGIYNKLEKNADYRSENFKEFNANVDNWKAINLPKIDLIRKLTTENSKFVESTDKLKTLYNFEKVLSGLQRFQGDDSAYETVDRTQILTIINEIKDSLFPYIKYKFW